MKVRFLIYFLLISIFCSAQSYNSYFHQFEGKFNYGISLPHHPYMNYVINQKIMLGELTYSIKTDGSNMWHRIWRCPEYGGGFLYGSLGNKKLFGHAISVYGFIGVPIVETNFFILKYRIASGLAYLTERYNSRENNMNIVIGSHFNAHVQLSLLADVKLGNIPLYFTGGIAFNHYSSGAIKMPNLGINQISVVVGLKYLYSPYSYNTIKGRIPYIYNKEWEISAFYAAGIKQTAAYSKYYFINALNADFGLRLTHKRTLGFGTRIIFDPSLRFLLENKEKYENASQMLRVGLHVFQEVYFLKDFSCLMQIGAYAYNRYSTGIGSWIYANIGLRYTFNNNMFVNIILKTQSFAADCIEFGVGYRFMRYE